MALCAAIAAPLLALSACSPAEPVAAKKAPPLNKFQTRIFSGRHAGGTLSVAFTPDSTRAISSGMDNTARIWDVPAGTLSKSFTGPEYHFQSIAMNAYGTAALTPAPDGSLNYWSIDTGKPLRKLTGGTSLGAVALSSDGKWAAGGGQDSKIHIWDLPSGSSDIKQELSAGAPVLKINFVAKNVWAILGDGRLCAWELGGTSEGKCKTITDEPASQGAFSLDGRRALIGTRLGNLVLWDIEGGAAVLKLSGTAGQIVAIAFSPGGDEAVSAGADKTVRLWDLATGTQTQSVQASASDNVNSVAFSTDGARALYGSSDGSVTMWQVREVK
jgi:WD40 repeat protein